MFTRRLAASTGTHRTTRVRSQVDSQIKVLADERSILLAEIARLSGKSLEGLTKIIGSSARGPIGCRQQSSANSTPCMSTTSVSKTPVHSREPDSPYGSKHVALHGLASR
jgi:hypothetical protein